MKNYLLIGTGFLVLLIVCVAVIHYEGQQTRMAIRESTSGAVSDGINKSIDKVTGPESVTDALGKIQGVLTGSDSPVSVKNLPELVAPAAQTAKEVMGEARGILSDVLGSATKDGGKPDDAARSKGGGIFDQIRSTVEGAGGLPLPGSNRDDEPKKSPASSTPADTDKPKDGDARGSGGPGTIVDGFFDLARRTTESGDKMGRQIFRLSADDERRWGKRLHEQVTTDAKVVRDPAVNKRIAALAAPLLKSLLRPEIEYTFTVLQSDEDDLNAFSLPGGYVYVHTALIDFVQNDDELQFVLGHEIGHVDLQHCANKLTYSARVSDLTSPMVGDMVGVLHNLLSRSYTQNEEFDADHYGFAAVIAAGQTRERALSFPRRFGKYLRDKVDESPRTPEERGVLGTVIDRAQNHFHTHPPMDERLKRLEAIDADAIKAKAVNERRETAK